MVDLGIATGELPAERRHEVLAMLETLTVGLIEVSAEPDVHRAAVAGFRRAVARLVESETSTG